MNSVKSVFVISRAFWINRIQRSWQRARIVWLTGVRRVGKTTLARAIPDAVYLNCDLPRTARELEEPERFFRSLSTPILILDEVHQLDDPSRVLKIAADAFPELRVIATGSSTLAATTKFRDSLTGRKRSVLLLPVLERERRAFGITDIKLRLLRGGLPEPLLNAAPDPGYYSEWLDSFFARDVQELFHIGKRSAFLTLIELLLRQSGGTIEVTKLARLAGLSRPTAMAYLDALEVTHILCPVRPFHGGRRREVLQRPKAYAFDTGFVAHAHGWNDLRLSECGLLWEHIVLDTLRSEVEAGQIRYWRDRSGHEIDFVVPRGRDECDAIECKWNPDEFEPKSLGVFRKLHPRGHNYVVSPEVERSYSRSFDDLDVLVCAPEHLAERMALVE